MSGCQPDQASGLPAGSFEIHQGRYQLVGRVGPNWQTFGTPNILWLVVQKTLQIVCFSLVTLLRLLY
jgi:hypothetical protein